MGVASKHVPSFLTSRGESGRERAAARDTRRLNAARMSAPQVALRDGLLARLRPENRANKQPKRERLRERDGAREQSTRAPLWRGLLYALVHAPALPVRTRGARMVRRLAHKSPPLRDNAWSRALHDERPLFAYSTRYGSSPMVRRAVALPRRKKSGFN